MNAITRVKEAIEEIKKDINVKEHYLGEDFNF